MALYYDDSTQNSIWGWKPGKPKGDFQWVQIKDISETFFLLQIALELTPKEIHDTNSEKY